MKPIRVMFVILAIILAGLNVSQGQDPLPSWNDGPAKQCELSRACEFEASLSINQSA